MKLSLFQGILVAVFGFSALIGLFVFATYTSNGTGKNGIGTVTVWGVLPKDGMNGLLATLTQTNTNFKGVTYVQKDPATLPNDLASAIATGNPPDLVLASQEQLLSLRSYLQPVPLTALSAQNFNSSFPIEAQLFVVPNSGGFYGIPFLIDPLVLYSNRTILASANIARPPGTWEALTGLVPALTVLTPNRQITRGLIALGGYDNVTNARGILSALFLQTNVPMSDYNSTGGLKANLGVAALSGVAPGRSVVNFYTQFADPSKVSYTWNASLPSSQSAFVSGDVALYLGYASEASFLQQANPNLSFDVSPLPQPGTATVKSTYGLMYALMIPRGAKNSAGAFQIAAAFTNDAPQAIASAQTGLAPATLTALAKPPANNPVATVAYGSSLYVTGWLSPDPASTDRVFSSMITNVISGRSPIDSALSSAEGTLGTLLPQ